MKEYLQPRDRCEAHILEAIDALAVALGIGAVATGDCAAARRDRLATAAREVAAAQAANDSPSMQGNFNAPPGD